MKTPVTIITEALGRVVTATEWLNGVLIPDFEVSHPKDEEYGDYATNLALLLSKKVGQNPREIAEKLITSLQNDVEIASVIDTTRISVAGPGFINFWIKEEWLLQGVRPAKIRGYGENQRLAGKKVMVEYTDPNPFKEMHIGHLMSNTIGEALSRLIEAQGAEVKRACYQGDVGLHVAKAIWGMQEKLKLVKMEIGELGKRDLPTRQKFMGEAYAYGATKYEESEELKAEMHTLNKQIYDRRDERINALYDVGRSWSLEYFETIYARLGTKFDQYFFESEAGPIGLSVVEEALVKGVLELGEGGAVVYRGEQDGLHTRVFRNKLGLATYEGKELGLAKTKYERYAYDLSYIVTANEITEYFKVLLAVMHKLYPEIASKTVHVPHGVMKLTTGKMSSRTGKVVTGEGLLNNLKEVVLTRMGEREVRNKEQVADQVAVSALKYTVLRQQVGGDIVYDPEKMTKLEGATGPFVQYAYARACSILAKFKGKSAGTPEGQPILEKTELAILRWLYRYPEVVEEAGRALAPHMVVTYITELSARFNTFYQACRVEEEGVVNTFRYELTEAVSNVLMSGLNTLGIVAVEEM